MCASHFERKYSMLQRASNNGKLDSPSPTQSIRRSFLLSMSWWLLQYLLSSLIYVIVLKPRLSIRVRSVSLNLLISDFTISFKRETRNAHMTETSSTAFTKHARPKDITSKKRHRSLLGSCLKVCIASCGTRSIQDESLRYKNTMLHYGPISFELCYVCLL